MSGWVCQVRWVSGGVGEVGVRRGVGKVGVRWGG